MIKQITIKDFKSIRDQTVDLGKITVLIGRSGAGKSNFIQAIRFLRDYVIKGDHLLKDKRGWAYMLPAGVPKPAPCIDVTFSASFSNEEYRYRIAFAESMGQQPQLQEEFLSLGGRVIFHRALQSGVPGPVWRWQKAPAAIGPTEPQGALAITRLPAMEEVVYAYTALSTGIGYYNLPTSVLVRPPANKAEQGSQVPGLWDDARNYLDVMRAIAQDFQHPEVRRNMVASLRQLNPSIRSVELDSVIDPKNAIIAHDVNGKALGIELEQESDGLRRFYAHLLALYQRPPKLLNIFEEPENAIYPGALELLAGEFKQAPGNGRGQVILTTHSPEFLDHMSVDDIRVVEMHDGQTVIGSVALDQKEAVKENLLTTGELLTVDRARLAEPEPAGT